MFVKGQSNHTDSGKSIASKNKSYEFIKLSTFISIINSSSYFLPYCRLLPCHPIRSAVNRRGEILPKHQRDQNFNLNDFVRSLRLGEYSSILFCALLNNVFKINVFNIPRQFCFRVEVLAKGLLAAVGYLSRAVLLPLLFLLPSLHA